MTEDQLNKSVWSVREPNGNTYQVVGAEALRRCARRAVDDVYLCGVSWQSANEGVSVQFMGYIK